MKVSIIGTGYVGLVTGACLARLGHRITCVDVVPARLAAISGGSAPFYEPGLEELLKHAVAAGQLRATSDLDLAIRESEITFITVGTPFGDGGIDLGYVGRAAEDVGVRLRNAPGYHVVVVKSTVTPGTTGGFVRDILERTSGRRAGEFGLCMNPEFLREGSAVQDFIEPDRIVIGQWDNRSGQILAELYKSFQCPKIFTTPTNAELIKYTSNALLATLISFSNEIAAICERTPEADVDAVMDGLYLDRRLSPIVTGARISPAILTYLRAGCGFGGSCLPKDVRALSAYAGGVGVRTHVLDAVMAVNIERPGRLVDLAQQAMGSLEGANVAVLGLAFKPGTDDLRDSPTLAIIRDLLKRGASVRAYDPLAAEAARPLLAGYGIAICSTPEEALQDADAGLVVTGWPEFAQWHWTGLCARMRRPIIIDGRNVMRGLSWPDGVQYIHIGCHRGDTQASAQAQLEPLGPTVTEFDRRSEADRWGESAGAG